MAEFPKYIRIDVVGPDENGHVKAKMTWDDNVKPVVKGKWQNPESAECYQCSACGKYRKQEYGLNGPIFDNFCSNCGAEMRAANDRPYGGTDSSTPLRSAQNDDGGEGD